MILVLDASVAVKWATPALTEPLSNEARRLLARHMTGQIEFVVPDIFWAEFSNVLWKGVNRGRWSYLEARRAIAEILAQGFVTVPSVSLLLQAVDIAFETNQGVYDCLYAALALEAQTDLITADERLANALAARFPVKWLGAF